ncbi:hypothetical protein [Listeria valentina]|uniref:hypothetical protein n=1 Tax=Listeria valentina TaxID=2705293 RepID=UPI00143212D2|nr:hypothetical protein [Listeria valentina]
MLGTYIHSLYFWYFVALFGLAWLALGVSLNIGRNWIHRYQKKKRLARYFQVKMNELQLYHDVVDPVPYLLAVNQRIYWVEMEKKSPFPIRSVADVTDVERLRANQWQRISKRMTTNFFIPGRPTQAKKGD